MGMSPSGLQEPSQRPREGTKNGHAPGGAQKTNHPAVDGPQPYPRK